MSGSENGSAGNQAGVEQQQRAAVSPGRTIGARSASPAKRSAADMEDVSSAQPEQQKLSEGSRNGVSGSTDSDQVMSGMTPADGDNEDTETQTTGASAARSSVGESMDTSATSFTSINGQSQGTSAAQMEPYSTQQIDEQVAKVHEMNAKELDDGFQGVVISNKWLARVLSRSTEGLKKGEYPKGAREGHVGPLDNSDIVPEDALNGPYLQDAAGKEFIPLKPGLRVDEEITVLPREAYGYIIGNYGYADPKKPIARYAHNTADDEATEKNIMYETYPPIITVRKVPQPADHSSQSIGPKASFEEGRLQKEREGRGQRSSDDAVRLVASGSERAMDFLTRAKKAAGIPHSTKVKIWRQLNPNTVAVNQPNNQQAGVLSPPASRDASPSKPGPTKLVVDQETFSKLDIGKDIEFVDFNDQTNNANYNGKRTMDIATLGYEQTIILEEQTGGPGGGEFQSDSKSIKFGLDKKNASSRTNSAAPSGRASPAPGGMMTRGRTRKDGRTIGTVGLSNLGNTCYMNSALQCIRSVEELAVYFLTRTYKGEINNSNPLGHHGALANEYFKLLNGIYGGQSSHSFTPSDFKRLLGRLAPTFSGYGQQDSQEFLSFLVDGLHEDLNRVIKKPYIENPDSDDDKVRDPQYIHELGETFRNNHRARNDSVAMDLFSGFYKNTMECPECDKVSVTFDPYSLLTVQLPMDVAFTHDIVFMPLHGQPVIHNIDIDKNSTVKALKEYIAKKHSTDADRLWMVEVYSHKIYKAFDDQTTLAEANIQGGDHLFIYELEDVPTNKPSSKKSFSPYGYTKSDEDKIPTEGMDSAKADLLAVPVFQRTKNSRNENWDLALHPLYITVTRDEAQDYDKILKKVLMAVQNITSRKILRELADESPSNGVTEVEQETNKDHEQSNEDAAGVSDHSAQSEESYVNVSRNKHSTTGQSNGASPMQIDGEGETTVPAGFMDPEYFVSPGLRHHLFELKFAASGDSNMHCAGFNSVNSSSLRLMHERVNPRNRRASLGSSSSEGSTSSTGSGNQANSDDESDEDDPDKPDITLGGESTLSAPTVESDEDELASDLPTPSAFQNDHNQSRGGRKKKSKKGKKGGKGKKNQRRNQLKGPITYSKNDKVKYGLKNGSNRSGSALFGSQDEDSPYYIQIGEAIVLDWRAEGYDSLFDGDENDPQEMRGYRFIDDNGKSGQVFHDEELQARKSKRAERKKHGLDLEDCFTETSKREVLSSDNSWYCNRCKELRQAYKQLEIWTLPDILVVHLKRFGGNRSLRDKLDVMVEYPIEGLDMSDKVGLKEDGKQYIYDLFAVDNHFGGLGGGHYTAYAKNFFDGQWYEYNDSSCTKLRNEPRTSSAYLLFYRRRSEKPLGPPALQELVTNYRADREADEAGDGESGEGKLGGLTHSSQQHGGSSSILAGAGAAKANQLGRGLAGNGGVGVGSPLTQRTTTMNSIEGEDDGGAQVRGLTDSGWNFSGVDDNDDGDADSTIAQGDRGDLDEDSGFSGSNYSTDYSSANATGARNSPADEHGVVGFTIDGGYDGVGSANVEDKDDDPVAEVHLSEAPGSS